MGSSAPAGPLRKLESRLEEPVRYALPVGDASVPLAERLGRTLRLRFLGEIRCLACQRVTPKSHGQGHCWRCFTTLARCDACIVSPERCHFAAGTCREPAWGQTHCMIPHLVYLANSSGLKVGITRAHQATTRWMDQGASAALPILRVPTRLDSGRVEVAFRAHVSDRTDWRAMLRGDPPPIDLEAARDELVSRVETDLGAPLPGERPKGAAPVRIRYPVLAHPEKPRSLDLGRVGTAEGTLLGIKGQYLILDTGVVNVRRHGGYCVALEA